MAAQLAALPLAPPPPVAVAAVVAVAGVAVPPAASVPAVAMAPAPAEPVAPAECALAPAGCAAAPFGCAAAPAGCAAPAPAAAAAAAAECAAAHSESAAAPAEPAAAASLAAADVVVVPGRASSSAVSVLLSSPPAAVAVMWLASLHPRVGKGRVGVQLVVAVELGRPSPYRPRPTGEGAVLRAGAVVTLVLRSDPLQPPCPVPLTSSGAALGGLRAVAVVEEASAVAWAAAVVAAFGSSLPQRVLWVRVRVAATH